MVMFSMMPPSTSSSARPRQPRKVQLATVTLRKPPLASVPNLIRPVPRGRLHRAVEQRAFLEAGHLAVHDRQVFRDDTPAQRKGAFRAQAVVARRIDAAIGDHRVAAAINVNAVAVGVHRHVVHRQVVAAGDENGKVTAVKNRDVANQHVAAQLERDGLVAEPDRREIGFQSAACDWSDSNVEKPHISIQQPVAAHQPAAVDHAVAGDGNVCEVFAPDEAVVKIAVPAVLIGIVRATARSRRRRSSPAARPESPRRRPGTNGCCWSGECCRTDKCPPEQKPFRRRLRTAARIARLIAGLSRFVPSPTAPKLRMLKTVLSSGKAIADRRRQKDGENDERACFHFPMLANPANGGNRLWMSQWDR